jgi:formate dehydrogenase subunit gamma
MASIANVASTVTPISTTARLMHVYAPIWVRGTISAMTRGTVTGGWGWRHHRKWLRKEVDKGEIERPKVTAAE